MMEFRASVVCFSLELEGGLGISLARFGSWASAFFLRVFQKPCLRLVSYMGQGRNSLRGDEANHGIRSIPGSAPGSKTYILEFEICQGP